MLILTVSNDIFEKKNGCKKVFRALPSFVQTVSCCSFICLQVLRMASILVYVLLFIIRDQLSGTNGTIPLADSRARHRLVQRNC